MAESRNLVLDRDPDAGDGKERLRIAVGEAWAFTRHGGAATVTRDCTSLAAFEREVARLHGELDEALAAARAASGTAGAHAAAVSEPRPENEPRTLPRLDTALRVRDVMTTDVRTMGPNDRLEVADELMQQGGFRHVVVVDEGRVVGVVSRRDIFHGALAWSLGQGRKAYEARLGTSAAKEVMASDVATVDPEVPLAEAAALMRRRQIGCLPVVAGDRLVGVITEGDFLALLAGAS